jgi:hypothetical protein
MVAIPSPNITKFWLIIICSVHYAGRFVRRQFHHPGGQGGGTAVLNLYR